MDRLAARIKAVNMANEYARQLYPILVKALTPFIGKKVVNQTGALSERLVKAIPKFPCNSSIHVYCCSYRSYTLSWVVKVCVIYPSGNYGDVAEYYETSVGVGKIENGILVGIDERFNVERLRTDYTVEEIKALNADYLTAKAVADEKEGKIPYAFSEFKNY